MSVYDEIFAAKRLEYELGGRTVRRSEPDG
jgi:hypothetical protein